ncbi:hypothetical protein FEZ08_10025 [Culicoidibacter larvae]|uniref:Gram-positive cocci surface proteins LPxTG domain-containing protein n=2 Tax=Culicoidibacter larvae TaxID=2579976 RepID=A0A5R8Q822_9FIRM|nr:hypothetical protein FEZ08_10025 [Culicoidibacter larvae]
MPASDMTLHAQYTINSYLITFNNQDTITTELLTYDSTITEPATPTKAGYTFTGWFTQASGGTQWNFATDKVPATNVTLYAQFSADNQTITFNVNGGDAASKPANIVQATDSAVNLDAVTVPTKPGYNFIGWFDAGDVQHSGTITMPVGGLDLIAHWTAAQQVISFNTAGGSGVNSITAVTDSTIDLDTISTTRAGYQFDGWFIGNTEYSGIITVPVGGLTFTAHWTALDQTITFDTDGAGTIVAITAPTDSNIDLTTIAAPSKFAYKFLGWFDANGVKYSGTIAMPAGGLQLQAHWQDLIAEGIWSIKANNIELSMSELNQFIDNGTLEQEVLNRANAIAWDGDQNVELSPLRVDTTTLLANVVVGNQLVTISYLNPNASVAAFATTNAEQGLVTTITVSVTDDTKTPGLPVTGQNILLAMLSGVIMTIVAALLLLVNKRRKTD